MNRDELAALPIHYDADTLPLDLLGAGAASDYLGIEEYQLYLLMAMDLLKPTARLYVENVHWSRGKHKWARAGLDAFLDDRGHFLTDEQFLRQPARMYAGPVAHLVADHPNAGPPARGDQPRFVELDWPRPYCGVTNLAESWRGRAGRWWEMEKCYTMRVCKACVAVAGDPTLAPTERAERPTLAPMTRYEAVRWLVSHVRDGIEADWQSSEAEREMDGRRMIAALMGLDVSVTELRHVHKVPSG
jgi:hypothetical protein